MYEYFKGTLVEAHPSHAVIDVNGIGYKILIPTRSFGKLPQVGNFVCLYTSWVVREASQTLFGFITKDERNVFEILITLSGIGPKSALGIIGHLELSELVRAVQANQISVFAKVPGVGRKTAERLIIDLKGKIDFISTSSSAHSTDSDHLQDALNALLNLGYSPSVAEKAVKQAASDLKENYDLSALITEALKNQTR